MTEEIEERTSVVRVDAGRLKRFAFRLVAGVGTISIWTVLFAATIVVLWYAFVWVSALPWFSYLAAVLVVPIGVFVWWVCFQLSVDFLRDIGVDLEGPIRFLIFPIAVPAALLSFVLGLWAAAGETINSRAMLVVSFGLGAILLIATTWLFL